MQLQATGHGPRTTDHGPCPSISPHPFSSPAGPIAWVRPWVSLTLTLLTSKSKSKSRDFETRQSRPSLAELRCSTYPLILFNFIRRPPWLLVLIPSAPPSLFLIYPRADWHSRGVLLQQIQLIRFSTPCDTTCPNTHPHLHGAGFLHHTIYT